jgi:uncharacterized protein YxeA
MKKFYFILGIIILVWIIILGVLTWQKNSEDKSISQAKIQANNYLNYKFDSAEFNKLKRSDKNDIYYYAADGKRYIFPAPEIYKSWFEKIQISDIQEYDLNKFYETPLGGNVTFRPGSLITTPSLYDVYSVIKNGQIKKINQNLLSTLYGEKWKDKTYSIPEFYFSQYQIIEKPINTYSDFPNIPAQININQDKGLK